MILVTGATGNIGSEVVRLLTQGGHPVRVLTRNPAKVAHLGASVEVAQGDLTEPAALAAAFAGVEKAFILAVGGEEMPALAGNAFDAAKAAGVRHIVNVSSGTIAIQPEVAIARWHRLGEERLRATGVAWTMLRPGNFASNALRWAHTIKAQGAVYGTTGSGKSAVIDPRDIAAVGVKALTTAGHEGKTYQLTGPELVSATEQLQIIGELIGKPLKFVDVPEAGARMGMLKSGMSELFADALLELMRAVRSGQEATVSPTVREVLGRDGYTFKEWATENRAAFQ